MRRSQLPRTAFPRQRQGVHRGPATISARCSPLSGGYGRLQGAPRAAPCLQAPLTPDRGRVRLFRASQSLRGSALGAATAATGDQLQPTLLRRLCQRSPAIAQLSTRQTKRLNDGPMSPEMSRRGRESRKLRPRPAARPCRPLLVSSRSTSSGVSTSWYFEGACAAPSVAASRRGRGIQAVGL